MSSGLGYLRVYEPVAALPEAERVRWAAYAAEHAEETAADAMARERAGTLAAALARPPRLPPAELDDEAFVLTTGDRLLVCPWRTRSRARSALAQAATAEELLRLGYPEAAVRSAEQEERSLRRSSAVLRVPILSSGPPLPPTWLMLFEPGDRQQPPSVGGGAPPGTARVLVYRVPMPKARQRAARVLHLLRREADDEGGFLHLEGVARWLEEFHPHSVVELDYATLTDLFAADALAEEDSVGTVGLAVACLARGDLAAAYDHVETMITKWRELASGQPTN